MEKRPQAQESSSDREMRDPYLSEKGLRSEIKINKELLDFLVEDVKDAVLNGKADDSEFGKVRLELEEIRKKLMEMEGRYRFSN